ncbi:MAG: hypothetical protein IH623_28500 [Verrucomicrobia bacterium]|nr:hypothetical protein [Verrucomicrobiota bacterium]
MATTKTPGVTGFAPPDGIQPAQTPGTLGLHDRADPDGLSFPGDSPGTVGFNDSTTALAGGVSLSSAASTPRQMTPLDFEAMYHELAASYFERDSGFARSVSVDVHIYANNGIPRRQSNLGEKDRLVRLVRSELRAAQGLPLIDLQDEDVQRIARTFFAKGSPEDCATTFRHALRYERITPEGIQQYCDTVAKIGLDCSGLVNNYFLAIGRISRSQTISTYGAGRLRSSFDEIQDLDVLVWEGGDGAAGEHIAVIDHKIAGTDRMVVVESSGSKEGLVHNEYTVLEVRDRRFRVDRGPDANGRTSVSQVRIAEV